MHWLEEDGVYVNHYGAEHPQLLSFFDSTIHNFIKYVFRNEGKVDWEILKEFMHRQNKLFFSFQKRLLITFLEQCSNAAVILPGYKSAQYAKIVGNMKPNKKILLGK